MSVKWPISRLIRMCQRTSAESSFSHKSSCSAFRFPLYYRHYWTESLLLANDFLHSSKFSFEKFSPSNVFSLEVSIFSIQRLHNFSPLRATLHSALFSHLNFGTRSLKWLTRLRNGLLYYSNCNKVYLAPLVRPGIKDIGRRVLTELAASTGLEI